MQDQSERLQRQHRYKRESLRMRKGRLFGGCQPALPRGGTGHILALTNDLRHSGAGAFAQIATTIGAARYPGNLHGSRIRQSSSGRDQRECRRETYLRRIRRYTD